MNATLEHDPEKGKPVFQKDHALTRKIYARAFGNINHSPRREPALREQAPPAQAELGRPRATILARPAFWLPPARGLTPRPAAVPAMAQVRAVPTSARAAQAASAARWVQ